MNKLENAACPGRGIICILPDGCGESCCGVRELISDGNPLYLGNIKDTSLKQMIDHMEKDLLISVMWLLGPVGLYNLIKDKNGNFRDDIEKNIESYHECELCLKITNDEEVISQIRKVLREKEMIKKIKCLTLLQNHQIRLIKNKAKKTEAFLPDINWSIRDWR
jgi:hypothetical protein